MTKRRVENEIDELSDEILENLSPDERLALTLTASAEEKDEWLTQLRETCPREVYEQNDVQYTKRARLAFLLAKQAVYDLHTTWLMFEWTYLRNTYSTLIAFCTDLDLEQYGLMDASEATGSPGGLLRSLALSYKGYERFADEKLGVALETWLAVHPEGQSVATAVAEVLEEHEGLLAVAGEDLTAEVGADESNGEVPVDELADIWYRNLKHTWTAAVTDTND